MVMMTDDRFFHRLQEKTLQSSVMILSNAVRCNKNAIVVKNNVIYEERSTRIIQYQTNKNIFF